MQYFRVLGKPTTKLIIAPIAVPKSKLSKPWTVQPNNATVVRQYYLAVLKTM